LAQRAANQIVFFDRQSALLALLLDRDKAGFNLALAAGHAAVRRHLPRLPLRHADTVQMEPAAVKKSESAIKSAKQQSQQNTTRRIGRT
jgi:hypothetical protein